MAMMAVAPWAAGRFLILLYRMTAIPDHVRFNSYCEATCEIALSDEDARLHDCVVHRPGNSRNIAGDRITDWLALVVDTELTEAELSSATIGIARYGREISEQEAMIRAGRRSWLPNADGGA
jgi:hypothetical protein